MARQITGGMVASIDDLLRFFPLTDLTPEQQGVYHQARGERLKYHQDLAVARDAIDNGDPKASVYEKLDDTSKILRILLRRPLHVVQADYHAQIDYYCGIVGRLAVVIEKNKAVSDLVGKAGEENENAVLRAMFAVDQAQQLDTSKRDDIRSTYKKLVGMIIAVEERKAEEEKTPTAANFPGSDGR